MHADPAAMAELLMYADLFYFAGVHCVPPTLNGAMKAKSLVNLLRERIQYNQCGYFGASTGAIMAGATSHLHDC